jgi:hypothetical protein
MSSLHESFDKLTLNNSTSDKLTFDKSIDFKKILYYSVAISEESIDILHSNTFISQNLNIFKQNSDYIINDALHITMLYTGGKLNTNALFFNNILFNKIFIIVDSFAISDSFITIKVSNISDSSNVELPYFGNIIKHITFALKKGLKPVNSPSAFLDGKIIFFDKPITLIGVLKIVTK